MKILIILSLVYLASSAPQTRSRQEAAAKTLKGRLLPQEAPSKGLKGRLLPHEQAMMHQLHQPWRLPDNPPEHPRKGEVACNGGLCRPKKGCWDCQHAKPLDF